MDIVDCFILDVNILSGRATKTNEINKSNDRKTIVFILLKLERNRKSITFHFQIQHLTPIFQSFDDFIYWDYKFTPISNSSVITATFSLLNSI